MDFADVLAAAEQSLVDMKDELAIRKAAVASLEQDVKRLTLEVNGMRSYASRFDNVTPTAGPEHAGNVVSITGDLEIVGSSGPNLATMARTDAVLAVMAMLGGPTDRTAIAEGLGDGGRFESIDDVSLTLSGLKRSGRVERLGQGLWQLADIPTAAEV